MNNTFRIQRIRVGMYGCEQLMEKLSKLLKLCEFCAERVGRVLPLSTVMFYVNKVYPSLLSEKGIEMRGLIVTNGFVRLTRGDTNWV